MRGFGAVWGWLDARPFRRPHTVRMRACRDAPATHYRLSAEVKAKAVEEYLDGATAKEVAAKWKTSAGSVYRWAREACPGGKRAVGDARARAHARMVEEEEAATRALRPSGSRALAGLFAPPREGDAEAADPAALMRLATIASGRAMTGRLWAEARALAGLAESYARLGDRRGGGMARNVDDVPLDVIADILLDPGTWAERMHLPAWADEGHPDQKARRRYWQAKEEEEREGERWAEALKASIQERKDTIARLQRQLDGRPAEAEDDGPWPGAALDP